MMRDRLTLATAAALTLSSAVAATPPVAPSQEMATVEVDSPAGDLPARVVLRAPRPVVALHFASDLGDYRAREWALAEGPFRWVKEQAGERLERSDGKAFSEVAFTVAQRYYSLSKSYAPFSPFSDGGLLVYTGHFHACLALPCTGRKAVAMTIKAPTRTIRVGEVAGRERLGYLSHGDGTNIYLGTLEPQVENGMSATIDPDLPERLRAELARALPASLAHFAERYGPLSFEPQLFVSIDTRGRGDGNESTQGGTLPQQIFIHFDGAQARERAEQGERGWLAWFFTHEVAHMFQRDRTGDKIGDDQAAWMHEGGADAMAALALLARGEGAYVATRIASANEQCLTGLRSGPLTTASRRGRIEMHYSCGLIATLAVADELRAQGSSLEEFNHRWFATLARGQGLGREGWLHTAAASGVGDHTLRLLRDFTGSSTASARAALEKLASLAVSALSAPVHPDRR